MWVGGGGWQAKVTQSKLILSTSEKDLAYSKGKIFAPHRSKFFAFRETLCQKGLYLQESEQEVMSYLPYTGWQKIYQVNQDP